MKVNTYILPLCLGEESRNVETGDFCSEESVEEEDVSILLLTFDGLNRPGFIFTKRNKFLLHVLEHFDAMRQIRFIVARIFQNRLIYSPGLMQFQFPTS